MTATADRQKVTIITGAGSGIGKSSLNFLADAGYLVVAVGRSLEKLQRIERTDVYPYACDVSDSVQVGHVVESVMSRFGRIDCLVNCAGIYRTAPSEDLTAEAIREIFDINLIGTINFCLAALPHLKQTRGTVINVGSGLGTRPRKGTALYAASKAAVESFTRALAVEFGETGIRINAVSPGFINTEILDHLGPEKRAELAAIRGQAFPLKRAGTADDVGAAIAFLASDAASWITGAVIPIDGGAGALGV